MTTRGLEKLAFDRFKRTVSYLNGKKIRNSSFSNLKDGIRIRSKPVSQIP